MKSIKIMPKVVVWLSLFIAIYYYCRTYLSYNYYFVEQFSFFRFSREYAEMTLNQPGGLGKYIAEFLTQFYIYPEIGPLITAFLGVLLTILLDLSWCKISHKYYVPILSSLPALTLIWAETDFNYYLSGSVSLILAVGIFYAYMKTAHCVSFPVRILLLAIFTWPANFLLGANSLLMVMLCILYELNIKEKRSFLSLLVLPIALISPIILYYMELGGELKCQLLPIGYYNVMLPAPLLYYFPWISVFLNIALAKLFSVKNSSPEDNLSESSSVFSFRSLAAIIFQFVAVIGIMHWGVNNYNLANNYGAKALDYYARKHDWQTLLASKYLRASKNFMHTCYQNLALSSLNKMGDSMFRFPQLGPSGMAINWNMTVNSSTLLSDIYWQVGDVALAQDMAFEGMIASRDGVNPRLLMRLVQTNLVAGNYRVAEKYISMLEDTYVYARQASKYRPLLNNDNAILADPELGPRRLCMQGTVGLTGTKFLVEDLVQIMEKNPSFVPAFHYFGGMCLLLKDMASFKNFITRSSNLPALKNMPVHFQEAIILLNENNRESWDALGVSSEVQQRYEQYRKLFLENRRTPLLTQKMARSFGDTYWFYYMFKK